MLAAWAGLGYYARARNLHACAREVVARHGGRFPATEAELRTLPGIGDYTAAAIAAIAFGARATPIDGNIERVIARLFAVATPLPAAKPEIRNACRGAHAGRARGRFCARHDGSRRHAVQPAPSGLRTLPGGLRLSKSCAGLGGGSALSRRRRRERPTRRGVAFVALRDDGTVLLRERPLKGLLGGMLETPSSPWTERGESGTSALDHAPLKAQWREVPGLVEHTFTHFHLELSVYFAEVASDVKLAKTAEPERCRWVHVRRILLSQLCAAERDAQSPRPRAGREDG